MLCDVHKLIHSTKVETIKSYKNIQNLDMKDLNKLNKLRLQVGNCII